MPFRVDHARVGLLQEVTFNAPHEKILVRDNRQIARAYVENSEIGPPDLAGQLQAEINRHFLAGEQADLAAEKRNHVGAVYGYARWRGHSGACKAEYAGILQEKRALFRKEEREARQVDLSRIHLSFAKICIRRRAQF